MKLSAGLRVSEPLHHILRDHALLIGRDHVGGAARAIGAESALATYDAGIPRAIEH